MTRYLPFGESITLTDEQVCFQNWKFSMYDQYGIPYGVIDESKEEDLFLSQKSRGREAARILIMQGKELPESLKDRLIKYKNSEQLENVENIVKK